MLSPGHWTSALILGLLPLAATATGTDNCNPAGTWVVTISSPPETFIPPISELISFMPGGAVVESSSDLPRVVGQGAWKRRPNCRIEFKVFKQIFDQANLALLGFIRITGKAKIEGNTFSSEPGEIETELVFGPDPYAPPSGLVAVSSSLGTRMKAN